MSRLDFMPDHTLINPKYSNTEYIREFDKLCNYTDKEPYMDFQPVVPARTAGIPVPMYKTVELIGIPLNREGVAYV